MNRNVELRLRALDAFRSWRFDEKTHESLRRCQDQRRRNGVDGGQREDRSIVVLDGCLVRTMVIEHTVRGHVAMDHELDMSMAFTLVHVLGRTDW